VTESSEAATVRTIQQAIDATREGRYEVALKIFNKVYASGMEELNPAKRSKFVEGFSYYGVVLAVTQQRFRQAVDFCRKACDLQFYNGEHFANLARVYIAAGMRKKAVETLESAIKSLPTDEALIRFRHQIGVRSRPPIPFLSRDNPLNVALGKARYARKVQAKPKKR
jgi:tetratricopeptide (TPR) repeat protein